MKNKEFNKIAKEVINRSGSPLLVVGLEQAVKKGSMDGALMIHAVAGLYGVYPVLNAESILLKKGAEYSTSDRLSNFKIEYLSASPTDVLFGYATKHLKWCTDYIDGNQKFEASVVSEHFCDLYNYAVLGIALYREEKNVEG